MNTPTYPKNSSYQLPLLELPDENLRLATADVSSPFQHQCVQIRGTRGIATAELVNNLVSINAPVAIGVSGGKDSQAAALATIAYLDSVGHRGARILIHADLGSVEWKASLTVCQSLATHLGLELVVVRRAAGDLMQRWEARHASSIRRYAQLETITLILPWSTPSMRFCTSELKTHLILRELRRRYPGQAVLNVTGERRQEKSRAHRAVADVGATGRTVTWRPILEWTELETFDFIQFCRLEPHVAYTQYGMSRVSCRFCILAGLADLIAASRVEETHDLYRRMVQLEIVSTFGFQAGRWLADVAPHLLSESMREEVLASKRRAAHRVALERCLPKDILYVKGWPTRMLTDDEAAVLSTVRTSVSNLMGIQAQYLTVRNIHVRYAELLEALATRRAA